MVTLLMLLLNGTIALAAGPGPTFWDVTNKTCNGKVAEILKYELLHFTEGKVSHNFLHSENETEECGRVQVYHRQIESVSDNEVTYSEAAVLEESGQRTLCRHKENKAVISDKREKLVAPGQTYTLTLMGNAGSAEVKNSPHCAEGILHLDLKKRKS